MGPVQVKLEIPAHLNKRRAFDQPMVEWRGGSENLSVSLRKASAFGATTLPGIQKSLVELHSPGKMLRNQIVAEGSNCFGVLETDRLGRYDFIIYGIAGENLAYISYTGPTSEKARKTAKQVLTSLQWKNLPAQTPPPGAVSSR